MEKMCSRCKVVKAIEFFLARKERPGKYRSWCEVCRYQVKAQKTLEKYGPRKRGRPKKLTDEEVAAYKRESNKARRHMKRSAEGRYTVAQICALHQKQRYKCAVCGCCTKQSRHIDHIVPLAAGGTNWIENLQILCPTCNMRKAKRDPISFMQSIGRLI